MVFPVSQESHIVQLPAFIPIIFIVQIVLSVLILALAAYGISVFSYTAFGFTLDSDFTSVLALILVASILTWIILGYTITSSGFRTNLYNKWAVLGLLSLETIFWFAGFIAVAAIAGSNDHNWAKAKNEVNSELSGSGFSNFFSGSGGDFSSIFKRSLAKRGVPTLNDAAAAYDCGATTAGLGAVEFVLSTVVLVYFILGLIAHRRANPSASATTGMGKAEAGYSGGPVYDQQPVSGGPVTQEKPHEMVPVAGTPVNGGQYQPPIQSQYSGTPQPMQPQYGAQQFPQQHPQQQY